MVDITFFAGITGIDKSNFIQSLISKSGKTDEILHINFEDELTDNSRPGITPSDIPAFLDMPNPYTKIKIIEDTFRWIADKITRQQDKKKYIFFSMHLSYYKNSEFFPPLNTQLFSSLLAKIPKPKVKIITLIDDIFSIWNRIKEKEQDVYLDTRLRLREILAWRSLESLRSESLNIRLSSSEEGVLSSNNYLVSIRHPYNTFHNLIFHEKPTTVYLSYPITSTRITPEGISEINNYRKQIHEMGDKHGAAIFDPVTIDELSLVKALDESEGNNDPDAILKEEHRWPLHDPSPIVPLPNWPIKIPKQEIEEVKKDISNQIQSRDYALVDAATFLAVYRPFYEGNRSEGADAEIKHAKECGSTVVVYSLEEDEKKSGIV